MITTTDFAKYLSRFLSEYLPHERNVSSNTIASYRDAFLQFIDYMRDVKGIGVENLQLKDLTWSNVQSFLKWLLDVRKCSLATRNYRLAAIRSFCLYLQYTVIEKIEEWQKILTIKAIKTEGSTLCYLSTEGIKLVLEQPDSNTWRGRRDLALLSLMYDTGARVSEIADLSVDNVRISSEPYTIRLIGKGRKVRIVPLVREQVKILNQYMDENMLFDSNKSSSPLFYNNRYEKLTRKGITYILLKYVDMARKLKPELIPDHISCHTLRYADIFIMPTFILNIPNNSLLHYFISA